MPIVQNYIWPGAIVISDGWRAYQCLKDAGYNHMPVNHDEFFVDPDTGAHTQNTRDSGGYATLLYGD